MKISKLLPIIPGCQRGDLEYITYCLVEDINVFAYINRGSELSRGWGDKLIYKIKRGELGWKGGIRLPVRHDGRLSTR